MLKKSGIFLEETVNTIGMKIRDVYLDDNRYPDDIYDMALVQSYDEFVKYITDVGVPKLVSLDHDLAAEHYRDLLSHTHKNMSLAHIELDYEGYQEKTGYDAAKWLVAYCTENGYELPQVNVHSMNPVGKSNIINYINNHYKFEKIDKKCTGDYIVCI